MSYEALKRAKPVTSPCGAVTENEQLLKWVEEVAALCEPERIHWCDGSQEEYDELCDQLVQSGTFQQAEPGEAPQQLPGLVRSDRRGPRGRPHLHLQPLQAGCRPDQQLDAPEGDEGEAERPVQGLHAGSHHVRHPLQHGPARLAHRQDRRRDLRLPLCRGQHAHHDPHGQGRFSMSSATASSSPACTRSARRSQPGQKDVPWPCNKEKYIVHFPEERAIWSFGSGYGGNALLGKKCLALRIASKHGKDEGWLAEHMLILGVESPDGEKTYVGAAFPSACGKTNFAMLIPPKTVPGQGLEGHHHRRRHRLDQAGPRRPALCHQPRIRLLRRRPRHHVQDQPQCHGLLRQELHLHQRGPDPGRRCLVGRDDRRGAGQADRLAGAMSGRPAAAARPPTPTPASPRRPASAPPSTRTGRTPKGADERLHLRRPPQGYRAAGLPGLQLELRRLPGRHPRLGDHCRRRRRHRQCPPRPLRHAPLLRLSHGRLLRPLAAVRPHDTPSRRASSASTGSARTPTASSSGPATAKTCAC